MMDNLNSSLLRSLPVSLTWEADLLECDGPFLSQFRAQDNEKYLYFWCDCDETHNRWMIFSVPEGDRARLISGKLSLRSVIDRAACNYVFFADINSEGIEDKHYLARNEDIPHSYFPEEDSFIEVSMADLGKDSDALSLLFDTDWDIETVRTCSRLFRQVYNFTLAVQSRAVSTVAIRPWRQGGFGSMHFFSDLAKTVNPRKRIQPQLMQFASPGILKLGVDDEVADGLFKVIKHYCANKKSIDQAHNALAKAITSEQLNQLKMQDAIRGFEDDDYLIGLLEDFVGIFGYEDAVEVVSKGRSRFETAKLFMAVHTRVKSIVHYINEGEVSVAQWASALREIDRAQDSKALENHG